MPTVLVVDDDQRLLRALEITLRARAYRVVPAATGRAALRAAAAETPDLVVLDLGLPDLPGIEVLEGLRGWTSVPILVLSGRDGSASKVQALDAGADDYVTKPFSTEELLARLRAAARRARPEPARAVRTVGIVEIDLAGHTVRPCDVHLTPTEWVLLEALVRHPGKLLPARQLIREVWGSGAGTDTGALRVHLANLRRKVEPDPSRPRHLLTEPGLGYRFAP